jgi:hypothetical protein
VATRKMTAEERKEPPASRWNDDTASGREKPMKAKPKNDGNHESYAYDWRQRKGLKRGKGY